MFVELWMKKNVITIESTQNLAVAQQIFEEHGFRRLPVVDDGQLVGIVSPSDISRALPSVLDANGVDEMEFVAENTSIASIMSTTVISVPVEANLLEAIRLMRHNKIGGLPVLADGRLVGIISITDILDATLDIMSTPGADMSFYLKLAHDPDLFYTMIKLFAKHRKEILAILQHYDFSKEHQLVTIVSRGGDYQPLIDELWANKITIEKITSLN